MPRTADHDQRRFQLTQAARAVADDNGLKGLTVARVAQRAGVSVGLVQHYFPSKDQLVARTYEHLLDGLNDRVARIVEQGEESGATIRDMSVRALAELLPLDDDRKREAMLRAEFRALACHSAPLAEIARTHDATFRARLAAVVVNATVCGEADAQVDADRAGADLWMTAVGAEAGSLLDAGYPALDAVEAATQRVFPGQCRRNRSRGA
ncbi:TetR/AcrR family transcriptional regulator [Corynebacterium sanguinis]|uniref:TetR family transcriptional regulator n=1 Tax=Corynebacterium sanguinis TaxID=2594913 RepID=A0A838WQN4_9CORY|nr:TetR/AcrR family transcriptional regulator [Corynebacterium sanguinis]MBA4504169.1 TetR family transcriptional regulator [Corynebacterium sanguinis]